MLSSINKKGPFTEGIFRKWADRDSCRVLTHRLNSGDKVNLDSESVLVVACVLKVRNLLELPTHSISLMVQDWLPSPCLPKNQNGHNGVTI